MIALETNDNGQFIQRISGKSGVGKISYSKEGIYRNTGTYEWSFICESVHDDDWIGVISSLKNIKSVTYASQAPGIFRYWSAHSGVWKNSGRYRYEWNKHDHELFAYWKAFDMITLQLNTNDNILTLMLNGKVVFKPLDLGIQTKEKYADDVVWYPFIQAYTSESKYIHIV